MPELHLAMDASLALPNLYEELQYDLPQSDAVREATSRAASQVAFWNTRMFVFEALPSWALLKRFVLTSERNLSRIDSNQFRLVWVGLPE